jgi:hypothetical protein
MDNFSIEVVVFGVLMLVIVLDLLIKGRKKKQDIQDESNLIKGKETTDEKKSSSVKRFFNYFIERPKNIGLYLISILIVKILINYFFYTSGIPSRRIRSLETKEPVQLDYSFTKHIEKVFELELVTFLYSFVIISFIVWQFNSYLKKR